MPELDPSLHQLADAYGIATDYWDWQGRHIEVARETVVAVLAALDVDASTAESMAIALEEKHRVRWSRMLSPCLVMREHRTASIEVHVPHGNPAETWIELETGGSRGPLRQLENWTRRGRSTVNGWGRPPSRSPTTSRWVITRCGPGPVTRSGRCR